MKSVGWLYVCIVYIFFLFSAYWNLLQGLSFLFLEITVSRNYLAQHWCHLPVNLCLCDEWRISTICSRVTCPVWIYCDSRFAYWLNGLSFHAPFPMPWREEMVKRIEWTLNKVFCFQCISIYFYLFALQWRRHLIELDLSRLTPCMRGLLSRTNKQLSDSRYHFNLFNIQLQITIFNWPQVDTSVHRPSHVWP